jgi:hypothetical protein
VSVNLYMDMHVRREVTEGLRRRGVDVVTAQEDGADTLPDPQLLDRAADLERLLFSQDEDLLAEAVARQRSGRSFKGVAYAHQLKVTIGGAWVDGSAAGCPACEQVAARHRRRHAVAGRKVVPHRIRIGEPS